VFEKGFSCVGEEVNKFEVGAVRVSFKNMSGKEIRARF